MEKIADNLKALRKKKGWSQAKVAERVPIDRTTYCKYESGRVEPPLSVCRMLCVVLDTTPNELLGWDEK